jgi:hypothetical protein
MHIDKDKRSRVPTKDQVINMPNQWLNEAFLRSPITNNQFSALPNAHSYQSFPGAVFPE